MAVGLMLVIPGAYSFISAIARRSKPDDRRYSAATSTIVASVGALALGQWLRAICAALVVLCHSRGDDRGRSGDTLLLGAHHERRGSARHRHISGGLGCQLRA